MRSIRPTAVPLRRVVETFGSGPQAASFVLFAFGDKDLRPAHNAKSSGWSWINARDVDRIARSSASMFGARRPLRTISPGRRLI